MILDVHSHAWTFPDHFSDDFRRQASRARSGGEVDLTVRYDQYRAQATPDTITIVFGGKAKLSGLWVDDQYVADYVAKNPKTLIGFLSRPDAKRLAKGNARRPHRSGIARNQAHADVRRL